MPSTEITSDTSFLIDLLRVLFPTNTLKPRLKSLWRPFGMPTFRFFFKNSFINFSALVYFLFSSEIIFVLFPIHTNSASFRFLEIKLRALSSLKNSGPFFSYVSLITVDSKKNTRYASFSWSVWDLLLSTVNPSNSNCVDNVDVALLICPQMMSGLLALNWNFTISKLFQNLFDIFDFLFLKNSKLGFSFNALQIRINFPIFSFEIAAVKFLLLSIGSIIIISVSKDLYVFPIICFCSIFDIDFIKFSKLPNSKINTSETYPLKPCFAISAP